MGGGKGWNNNGLVGKWAWLLGDMHVDAYKNLTTTWRNDCISTETFIKCNSTENAIMPSSLFLYLNFPTLQVVAFCLSNFAFYLLLSAHYLFFPNTNMVWKVYKRLAQPFANCLYWILFFKVLQQLPVEQECLCICAFLFSQKAKGKRFFIAPSTFRPFYSDFKRKKMCLCAAK